MTKKKVKKKSFLTMTTGAFQYKINSTINNLEINKKRKEQILSNFFGFTYTD